MASIPQRGTWNSETSDWRGTRFFAPAQRALAAAAAPVAAAPSVVLSPTPDPPAPAGPVVSLATATTVTTFLISSGPLGEAWDQLPGTAWPLADVPGLDAPLRVIPHTAQRDGAIDLLIAAGGDRRVLWLGCVIDAAVDSPVVPTIAAAVNVACYCSGQRIESGQAITLKAGRHPLWVVAAVQKPNPFTKRLPLRIGFAAAAAPSAAPPAIRTEPIPDPPGGTLYAASAPIDRQEIAAWPAILRVHHLLAAAEPDGLDTALAELAAMPSPTARRFGQACAAVIQEVEAAHQESDEILRWRLRSTAYFQAGLPQRSWAFEKLVKERWPGAPEAKPERIIP